MLVESLAVFNENGIEILESLAFDENEDICQKAMEILENHFGYDAEFFYDQEIGPGISVQGDSSKVSSTGPSPMISPV